MAIDSERRLMLAGEASRNEVLTEAFHLLHEGYIAAMRRCDPKDDLGRYRYSVALDVVDKVQNHLNAIMTVGKLEARKADELAERNRWIPKF